MSFRNVEGRLPVVGLANEILISPNSRPLIHQDQQQDEETSDCPLLTPSPPEKPGKLMESPLAHSPKHAFLAHGETDTPLNQTLNNINSEDGLAFLNIVNNSCKRMLDEPSSRDPMVETSSNSGSSSDTNEPVCTQLLTQLNTAYTHLAPDAQALFYNQDNGGKQPITGIQLVVPKPPKNYSFMSWNWPVIRKACFWSFLSVFVGCIALAISIVATMPKRCDPKVEWWQGSLFYEIFPASFQDSYKNDGIGDLRGITDRLNYLESLGVKGIRLNSIFASKQYPQRYMDIVSLTEIDPVLGTSADFANMVSSIHEKNMALILDLPLYPFIKNFGDDIDNHNFTGYYKQNKDSVTAVFPSHHKNMQMLSSRVAQADVNNFDPTEAKHHVLDNNDVTKAIKYWSSKGVDGFYLKGLEHYTNEINFSEALKYWKSVIGPNKILMCSEKTLETESTLAKNVILNSMNLVDVTLNVTHGTKNIKTQVLKIFKGAIFRKSGYPWIHWSTGNVDTPRLASTLKVVNASVAVAIMGMMLPGTPSIFYGDEIGIMNAENANQQNGTQLNQLAPMRWENKNSIGESVLQKTSVTPWISESAKPEVTNLVGLVPKMLKLRLETTPIYVKAVLKNDKPIPNGKIRYTTDEIIVIERWYPRRNRYVFLANLGSVSQTKDLSSLYYGGYVVVGPEHKMNQNIYFKELTIPPGEAFVIKLDK